MSDLYTEMTREDSIRCPHKECRQYLKFDQCNNHSYVLCDIFDKWYDRQPKDLNSGVVCVVDGKQDK